MRLRLVLPLSAAITASLYACDDDTHVDPPPIENLVLEGAVTDEAFVAFEAALEQGPPEQDPSRAASLDAPADGAVLPASPAPTFTWHFGATPGARAPAAPPLRRTADAAPPLRLAQAADAAPRWAAPLAELLGPMRGAHAHGDPFNGTATFLVFATEDAPELVRVFTSNTTYSPAADAWEKMTSAGAPITLTLVSADFEQNRVLQDGGPFAGSVITFTVSP